MPDSKAVRVSSAPCRPEFQKPVTITTRPVMEQITMVSMNTSKAPSRPCFTGWSVLAEACTMGEVPQPASLLYTERAKPRRIVVATPAPMKPPTAACSVKAPLKIIARAPGS